MLIAVYMKPTILLARVCFISATHNPTGITRRQDGFWGDRGEIPTPSRAGAGGRRKGARRRKTGDGRAGWDAGERGGGRDGRGGTRATGGRANARRQERGGTRGRAGASAHRPPQSHHIMRRLRFSYGTSPRRRLQNPAMVSVFFQLSAKPLHTLTNAHLLQATAPNSPCADGFPEADIHFALSGRKSRWPWDSRVNRR